MTLFSSPGLLGVGPFRGLRSSFLQAKEVFLLIHTSGRQAHGPCIAKEDLSVISHGASARVWRRGRVSFEQAATSGGVSLQSSLPPGRGGTAAAQ